MRFVLIDRIEQLEPGKRATGYKRIAPDEDYFHDHFPGHPVVPGVLVLESMAQLGGRLVGNSIRTAIGRRVLPMLAKVDHARFLQAVRPGDRLDLAVDLLAVTDDLARVSAAAHVDGRKVATAEMAYAILEVSSDAGVFDEAQVTALHNWSDELWRRLRGDS